jgi:hypothetical protein
LAALMLATLAATVVAHPAAADGTAPSDEDRANARALGAAGVALALAGKCDEAIPKLTAAEKLFHAPTTAEPLGQCLVQTGKVIAGTELLNRVAREALAANAPPAFVAARQRAEQEYDEGLKKVAKLRIHVAGATGAHDLLVEVDGQRVDPALLDNDRLTDPGAHDVTATATGCLKATAHVALKEGDAQDVPLSLSPDPDCHPPPPAPPEPTTQSSTTTTHALVDTSPSPARGGPNRVPAFIAFGAGGAGLVVGGIFGVMALSSKSSLDSACPQRGLCPASSQSDIDALHTNALVSTIGFGLAAVGAGVGAYLWLAGIPRAGATERRSAAITVEPWVGPATAGVTGVFQ